MNDAENPIVQRMASGEPFTFWDLVAAGPRLPFTPEHFVREWGARGWIKFDGEFYHLNDAGKIGSFALGRNGPRGETAIAKPALN
jgi:hypothetical protein